MDVTINGQRRTVHAASVADLLDELGMEPRRVAVERNRQLVPRAQFADAALEDGDAIEIVSFVGGG